MLNSKIYFAWESDVPNVLVICLPMPNTPDLSLAGGGVSRQSADEFLRGLEKDFKNQSGRYYAYILGHHNSPDESDLFILETWQILCPNDGTYEAIVILYYSAINPYLTIKKHLGEDLAEEYLSECTTLV